MNIFKRIVSFTATYVLERQLEIFQMFLFGETLTYDKELWNPIQ